MFGIYLEQRISVFYKQEENVSLTSLKRSRFNLKALVQQRNDLNVFNICACASLIPSYSLPILYNNCITPSPVTFSWSIELGIRVKVEVLHLSIF